MTYKYDVFLSYRRANEWPRFIEKHFKPKLAHWLDTKLGRDSKIFFDQDQIETGQAWPYSLADGLARSKIMVCLWSKQYFSSPWCRAELSQMLARRQSLTIPDQAPPRLIIAVAIDDCETVHSRIRDIQKFSLQDYSSPWIAPGSPKEERLSDEIERLAVHAARAITNTPRYDSSWRDIVSQDFWGIFTDPKSQHRLPTLG